MKYDKSRSLSFNLASAYCKDNFEAFNVSRVVKCLPKQLAKGITGAYDVMLGKDGDTVAILSLQRYSTNLPRFRNGAMVDLGERMVSDIMIATHSLKELGATWKDVCQHGIEANWIAANAIHFNSGNNNKYKDDAFIHLRDQMVSCTGGA